MDEIVHRLLDVRTRIGRYCEQYGRPKGSVRLVAVGKKHPPEAIGKLAAMGQQDFAENYLQEAQQKMNWYHAQNTEVGRPLVWHFIGHIQSRKCREIAERFDWVHTVASRKVATRLDQCSASVGKFLNVLIQVNIDHEPTKSGAQVAEVPALAEAIHTLPNLRLRGMMIIPRYRTSLAEQRGIFQTCRELQESLLQKGLALDHLSMGMTADMEAAIAEGATMLRVGTALFGPRNS